MKITAKIDVRPVATYYGQLAATLRRSLPDTVKYEAAATVRAAMQMVSSSKVSAVKERALRDGVASFRDGPGGFGGTTSVGKRSKRRGQQWMAGRRGGKVIPMGIWGGKLDALRDHDRQGWRTNDADWNRFKALWLRDAKETKASIKARAGARGITARSWLEILQKLNSDQAASVQGFIQRARPISGKLRPVGFSHEFGFGSSAPSITVTNTSGVAVAAGGDRKLQSAIARRRKFFMDSFRKGFFNDAKFVARNYPWAKVS